MCGSERPKQGAPPIFTPRSSNHTSVWTTLETLSLTSFASVLSPFQEEQKESRNNRETGGGGNPPNKIFSLKYIRTLLSEKYFKSNKNLSDKETGKEMVTLKSNGNGVTESLLENRTEDQQHQSNVVS